MLPFYQDKKKHVFRFAQIRKKQTKKAPPFQEVLFSLNLRKRRIFHLAIYFIKMFLFWTRLLPIILSTLSFPYHLDFDIILMRMSIEQNFSNGPILKPSKKSPKHMRAFFLYSKSVKVPLRIKIKAL